MKKPAEEALAALGGEDEEAPAEEEADMDGKAAAGDELAAVLNVPKEKRAAFLDALHAYIEFCA